MSFNNSRDGESTPSFGNRLLKNVPLISSDPLSANALLLLATWCMNAAVGFVFIILAAKLYSINAVGVSMLLIAYANIVVLFTRFGIEQSMIRFYDEQEKSAIYCASVLVTTIPAVGVGATLAVVSYLGFLGQDVLSIYTIILIIAVLLLSINEVSGFLFLAKGRPILYFAQSVFVALRLMFVIFLVPFGTLGLFSSLVIALAISATFTLIMVRHLGVHSVLAGKKFLRESFHFSLGNYASDFLQTAPVYLLPILVFAMFGEQETAIYSVGYAVASIAFLVPTAVGVAVFISGCQGGVTTLPENRIIIPALLLIGAMIVVFFFWGADILGILGPAYAATADLVVTIMGASLFALFFQLYAAGFKVRKEIRKLILLNGAFFGALLCLSYLFMRTSGLAGAGYAWLAAYALCVVPLGGLSLYKYRQSISS